MIGYFFNYLRVKDIKPVSDIAVELGGLGLDLNLTGDVLKGDGKYFTIDITVSGSPVAESAKDGSPEAKKKAANVLSNRSSIAGYDVLMHTSSGTYIAAGSAIVRLQYPGQENDFATELNIGLPSLKPFIPQDKIRPMERYLSPIENLLGIIHSYRLLNTIKPHIFIDRQPILEILSPQVTEDRIGRSSQEQTLLDVTPPKESLYSRNPTLHDMFFEPQRDTSFCDRPEDLLIIFPQSPENGKPSKSIMSPPQLPKEHLEKSYLSETLEILARCTKKHI